MGGQFNSPNGNPPTTAPYYTTNHTFTYTSNVIAPPLNVPCPPLYDPYMIPPPNPQNSALLYNPQYSGINTYKIQPPLYTPTPSINQTPTSKPLPPLPKPRASKKPRAKKAYQSWACTSIQSCKALPVVVTCLKHWHLCEDTGCLKNIFGALSKDNKYMHLVDAYHHLLCVHLSGKNSQAAYDYIHLEVSKVCCCSFRTCKSYTRNQRERAQEDKYSYGYGDQEYFFLQDLLDTIHAYFVHGYDSGHRYRKDTKGTKQPENTSMDDEKEDFKEDTADAGYLFDSEMQALQAQQASIRKQQRNQDKKSKFQTTINRGQKEDKVCLALLEAKFGKDPTFQLWSHYLLAHECDTDAVLEQIAYLASSVLFACFTVDEKEKSIFFNKIIAYIKEKKVYKKNNRPKARRYGLGVKLYYWDYYKYSQKRDTWYHAHTSSLYKDLYVPPAYLSFKNEILKKGISIAQWNQKIYEAEMMLKLSNTLRKIRSKEHKYSLCKKYKIRQNSSLSSHHIAALLFYANFPTLSTAFKATFQYLSPTEGLTDIIKRNAKWHFLSRYLREVVEIFGEKVGLDDQLNHVDKGSFYHRFSEVSFHEFKMYFYGPLSTSKQLAVPTLFADNKGIVVTFKSCVVHAAKFLKFFNVSLVSSFAAEEENLFIGGECPLQVTSIRLLSGLHMNIAPLIHTLDIVGKVIHGEGLEGRQLLPSDVSLFKKLLSNSPHFPHYIQQSWLQFKRRWRRRTKFNMRHMHTYYSAFIPLLLSSDPKYKHVLRFDIVAKTFPNTDEIICIGTDIISFDSKKQNYSPPIVGSNFILRIKDCVDKIAQDKRIHLKKITIKTFKTSIKDDCKLYEKQFRTLGWYVGKGIKTIELTKHPYDACIARFSPMTRGAYPFHEATSLTLLVFNQLMARAKEVPANMQQKWDTFATNLDHIHINIKHIHKYYSPFVCQLLSSDPKCKNLLLFDKLITIFPNIKAIKCTATDNITGDGDEKAYSPAVISSTFILGLVDMLGKMVKDAKLEKVMIKTSVHPIKENCALYARQFEKLGWYIGKGQHLILLKKRLYDDFKDDFIAKMSSMIEGDPSPCEMTSLDIDLLEQLITGGKKLPLDVQRAWNDFMRRQHSIEINIKCLSQYYQVLHPMLFSKSIKNLLLVDKISQLFPYATEITSRNTDFTTLKDKGASKLSPPCIVDANFIFGLLAQLGKIPKHAKLQKVIIKTCTHPIKVDKDAYATCAQLGWRLQKENSKHAHKTKDSIIFTRDCA